MKTSGPWTVVMMISLPVILTPMTAGAQNPWDVTPTGIGILEKGSNLVMGEVVGSPSVPTFDQGTELQITCFYKYLAGLPSTPPEWFVDIEVDGARIARLRAYNHEWKTSSSSGFDPSKITSGGFYSTSGMTIVDKTYPAIATWKATGGAHTVRCILDPDHRLPEKNEANNLAERKIQVKVPLVALKDALDAAGGRPGPTTPRARAGDQPAGQALAKPTANAFPGANSKSCRTSLSAKVALDPGELSAPGFQPSSDGVPQAKLTLYLQDSGAKGNYVFCDYASNKGDVKLSTTLQCKEASPTSVAHAYQCSP
ncbi:MAG TPA: hypothetical protein VJP59_11180 [Gemmatimonadota bacterium]|nr:hypothetical protein [Gemmatimonadota bacterium]